MSKKRRHPTAAEIFSLPFVTADELYESQLIPLSRNAIYAACNTGEIENHRIGRKIIIPTAPLRRKSGFEPSP